MGSPRYQLAVGGRLVPPTPDSLAALQRQLLAQIEAERDLACHFLEPVDVLLAPDYPRVIKNPIDLSTIRRRVDAGSTYVTMDIFAADVARIFANCKLYNSADTVYYKAAHKLAGMFQTWVNAAVHYELPSAP